jgi:hypothetical protein
MLPNIHVSNHRVHMEMNDTLKNINKQRDRIAAPAKKTGNPPAILSP